MCSVISIVGASFVFLGLSLVAVSGGNDDEGSLVFVNLLYRHGERTPVDFYPNDPWKYQEYWPVRPGQLMNAGKTRHYELGQWLRQRYDGFLSRKYDPAEIHIQSSNVDRTLMSAQCNLLGMYPPVGADEWNQDIRWQPIPVHTRPGNEDLYLRNDATCPAAEAEYIKVLKSDVVREIQKENKDLLDYLREHSGDERSDVIKISDGLYDTLFIESSNNFTLPEWTHAVYPDRLRPLAAFSFTMMSLSPTLRRLRGGPLVSLMVHNMKKKVGWAKGRGYDKAEVSKFDASFSELRKVEVYSAHGMTISMFLGALQMFPPQLPSYAATVMVELRQKNATSDRDDGGYFVKILYKNNTGLHTLTLPGCSVLCPLDDFDRLTQHVQTTEEEWRDECFERMPTEVTRDTFFAVFLAGILAVSAILMATIAYNIWKRSNRGSIYAPLHSNHM